MRVLFLHPEDIPWQEPWARQSWDLIVDLGFASRRTYDEWGRRLGARVLSLHEFNGETESLRWVNQFIERGRGRLLDRMGLDWWEILSMESHQDLQAFYLFQQVRKEVGTSRTELSASRPHRLIRIAEQVFRHPVRSLGSGHAGPIHRVTRKLNAVRNLRWAQISEIALDKWDSRYQLRRRWTKRATALPTSVVLIPSAYFNVTRSALAYASQLPNREFLLVTTRRGAVPNQLPANAVMKSLAAYVSSRPIDPDEAMELTKAWQAFLQTMIAQAEEFHSAADAGVWDYFPTHLAHGIFLRGAWTRLLDAEPVAGVLCGDDLNYHTRLPLMLAQRRGLNAVYCSHGALDGGFLFKRPSAETYLVKGEMEGDYLQRVTTIPRGEIVVAAPGKNASNTVLDQNRDALVFFSQPYEVLKGRTDAIYAELLPRLCSVAHSSGKKLVVKLHPFESRRARQKLVNAIVPTHMQVHVEILDSIAPEAVMARAWCGVTVDSSVAVECSLRKIPFFLCGWLDFSGFGYLRQFERYGVARVLQSPEEVEQIPQMVADFQFLPETLQRLWRESNPAQLDELMFGARPSQLTPCAS